MSQDTEMQSYTAGRMLKAEWDLFPEENFAEGRRTIAAGSARDDGSRLANELANETAGDEQAGEAAPGECGAAGEEIPVPPFSTALCLSGGGIRSATFCLGVLQGLAANGWLTRFNYLSTVSGGGYIGGWLTRWRAENLPERTSPNGPIRSNWSQSQLREEAETFAETTSGLHEVRRLRSFSNYLSPTTGLSRDGVTFLNSVLRKFIYNLVGWVALFLAIALTCRALVGVVASSGLTQIAQYELFDWARDPVAAATFLVPLILFCGVAVINLVTLIFLHRDWVSPEKASLLGARLNMLTLAWFIAFLFFLAIPEYLWDQRAFAPNGDQGSYLGLYAVISGGLAWLVSNWREAKPHLQTYAPGVFERVKAYSLELISFAALALFAVTSGYFVRWLYSDSPGERLGQFFYLPWHGKADLDSQKALLDARRVEFEAAGAQLGSVVEEIEAPLSAQDYLQKGSQEVAQLPLTEEFTEQSRSALAEAVSAVEQLGAAYGNLANKVREMASQLPYVSADLLDKVEAANFEVALAQARLEELPRNADLISVEGAQAVLDTSLANAQQAMDAYQSTVLSMELSSYATHGSAMLGYALLAIILAVVLPEIIGVNRSSIHSLYSTRLIRAYFGTVRKKRNPSRNSDLDRNDDIALSKLPTHGETGEAPQLFPVINMTLNLRALVADGGGDHGGYGARNDWQQRRGAIFTATPLHVGSPALSGGGVSAKSAYFPTDKLHGMTDNDQSMTLGRAMTISGAAASPNMGFYSRPLVMAMMAILNIRLGWWFPNPLRQRSRLHSRLKPVFEPLGALWYMLKEASGNLTNRDYWLYLSDGGHFDNLGLYEMVRRRCRQILVVDAGQDPDFRYEDLLATVQKIRVDFGIPIDLPNSLPGQEGAGKDQRMIVVPIRYSQANEHHLDGELILLKPMLQGNEQPGLLRYREDSMSSGGSFPHQTTADQFFDETQFECYRQLGNLTAGEAVRRLHADTFTLLSPPRQQVYPKASPTVRQPQFSTMSSPSDPYAMEPQERLGDEAPRPAGWQSAQGAGGKGSEEAGHDSRGQSNVSRLADTIAGALQSSTGGELIVKGLGAVALGTVTVAGAGEVASHLPEAVDGTIGKVFPQPPSERVIERYYERERPIITGGGGGSDAALAAAVGSMAVSLATLRNSVDSNSVNVGETNRQLLALNAAIARTNAELRLLTGVPSEEQGQLAELTAKIDELLDKLPIGQREVAVSGHEHRLDDIDTAVQTNTRDIATNSQRIGVNERDVVVLDGERYRMGTEMLAVQRQLDELRDRIQSLSEGAS